MGLGTYQGAKPFADDAVAGTPKLIKTGPGLLCAIHVINLVPGAASYLQFFDRTPGEIVLGTTAPYFWVRIEKAETLAFGFNEPVTFNGSGISIAGTTTPTGSTGVALSVTAFYIEA